MCVCRGSGVKLGLAEREEGRTVNRIRVKGRVKREMGMEFNGVFGINFLYHCVSLSLSLSLSVYLGRKGRGEEDVWVSRFQRQMFYLAALLEQLLVT